MTKPLLCPVNTLWEGLYTFLTEVTPIGEMTIPDAKLAPAEKHIFVLFFVI
jgi:hypothetical protein